MHSRENIIRLLQQFSRDAGRPPKTNDPGLETLVQAAKKEFGSWQYALKIAGLQTYKAWRKRKTAASQICNLLNHNPLTLPELRRESIKNDEEIEHPSRTNISQNLARVVQQISEIESIGPRRQKIYYLKGQEKLAQSRLRNVFSTLDEKQDVVFGILRKPMTKNEIWNSCPPSLSVSSCDSVLRELVMAGIVKKVKFVVGQRGQKKYSAGDIFGNLACKTYYFRPDCPEEIAKMILENISRSRINEHGFRSSLTHHLKNIFSVDIYSVVSKEISQLFREDISKSKITLDDFLSLP